MLSERVKDGERIPYWEAPRDWVGETVVIIGTGPSVSRFQADMCKGKARVIAVNNAYKLAPWADVLWACDGKWWRWYSEEALKFAGQRITLDPAVPGEWADLMENTGREGFDSRPWCIRTGANSGYQAVHLAVHRGAKRILLVGFDHKIKDGAAHFFGDHPDKIRSDYDLFIRQWATLVGPMREMGIEIVNCTPGSMLNVWPHGALDEYL